jgi:hypothetical protein
VCGCTNDAVGPIDASHVSICASKKQTDEDHRPMAGSADRIRGRADNFLGALSDLVFIAPAANGVSR